MNHRLNCSLQTQVGFEDDIDPIAFWAAVPSQAQGLLCFMGTPVKLEVAVAYFQVCFL